MTTIYWAGGEDCDMYRVGVNNSITTSTSWFRSAFARCALQCDQNGYWQNWLNYPGAPTSLWFSARLSANNSVNSNYLLKFGDVSNFTRLQLVPSGGAIVVQKVNTAGSATTLTNTLAAWTGGFVGA